MTEFSSLRQRTGLSVPELADMLGYDEREIYRLENGDVKPRRVVLDRLRALLPANDTGTSGKPDFTFIDLFAGIGGMRMGFEAAGGKCVFTSEWNPYSQKTYRRNFPLDVHEIAGDIQKIKEENIPPHDCPSSKHLGQSRA
jgi:DNA (cytosine-5)-methyltransferase 1